MSGIDNAKFDLLAYIQERYKRAITKRIVNNGKVPNLNHRQDSGHHEGVDDSQGCGNVSGDERGLHQESVQ